MPRQVAPRRVARFQRLFLQRMGASPAEIRRYLPVLTAQIGAESNFRQGVGSPAGARDIAQFMPGTARSYGVTLGDNRIRDDIRGQVRYMLPLLRKYGVEGALRGYNAGPGAIEASKGFGETNAYVARVMGSVGKYRGLAAGAAGGGGMAGLLAGAGGAPGASQVPGGGQGLASLLGALTGQQRQLPSTSAGALPAPSFAAAPRLAGVTPSSGGAGPTPKLDVGQLLSAVQGMADTSGTPGVPANAERLLRGVKGVAAVGPRGEVTLAPGADRPGVRTRPHVLNFLRNVAGIVGEPLTVGTGSQHSQYTTSGNVSDHWSGRAADVPLAGRELVRAGQAALIAAGMPAKKARKINGGLFNLTWRGRRVQIIFNTQEGGDHTDHLHVGLSARR